MAYKRQIAYWDFIEDGQKKGNAGFCKWEQREDVHILSISIHGLNSESDERLEVYTKAGGSLGELNLKKGRADASLRLEGNGQEICKELSRIWIPLSQGRELEARFETEEEQEGRKIEPVLDDVLETRAESVEDKVSQIRTESAAQVQEAKCKPIETEHIIQEYSLTGDAAGMDALAEDEQETNSLWELLATTNEKMRPFGTETEYYRITLDDIYRLKDACHVLRNNQFLLHGYYNYRYLILGKKDGAEDAYWLGVPGIYHEREKMAARMYGFEKFEGTKTDYRVGDLGYYLISAW